MGGEGAHPLEIEQQITFPVEQAIGGLPGLEEVRSLSKFGLSQVIVTFEEHTDIYFARQLVMERLQTVELSEGIARPEMGPVATGLGEIFHYVVRSDRHSLMELTTLHDWVIKPRLRSVPGVAEVNTWGGKRKQYLWGDDWSPDRLKELRLYRSRDKKLRAVGAMGEVARGPFGHEDMVGNVWEWVVDIGYFPMCPEPTYKKELRKLKMMHDEGLITDAEFQATRTKILNEM